MYEVKSYKNNALKNTNLQFDALSTHRLGEGIIIFTMVA